MKSTKEPENKRVAQEKKKATLGTAARDGLEGPKTTGGQVPKTAPIGPTRPVVATDEPVTPK